MGKVALVVDKERVLNIPYRAINDKTRIISKYPMHGDSLLELHFKLQGRDTCETDLRVLQLLPYITLIDEDTDKVFIYKRGGSGNEERLVGLHSIGLGGHIEEAPSNFSNIDDIILMNILRELNEEVGLEMTANLMGRVRDMLAKDKYTIMYAPEDNVGHYHLCMWLIIRVSKDDFGNHEENIITEGNWLTIEKLDSISTLSSGLLELEGWSKHCLNMLKELKELEKEI